jgi:hypothetical protein
MGLAGVSSHPVGANGRASLIDHDLCPVDPELTGSRLATDHLEYRLLGAIEYVAVIYGGKA